MPPAELGAGVPPAGRCGGRRGRWREPPAGGVRGVGCRWVSQPPAAWRREPRPPITCSVCCIVFAAEGGLAVSVINVMTSSSGWSSIRAQLKEADYCWFQIGWEQYTHTRTRTRTHAAPHPGSRVAAPRRGGKMSSGDVVCTGWLIKSPPEKKLKRYVSAEALLIFFFFSLKGSRHALGVSLFL